MTLDIHNNEGYAIKVLLLLFADRSAKEHVVFCHVNTFERYQSSNFVLI